MYSPLELEQIEFEKKAFGGYNQEDVDQTFGVLKRDYEELYIENATMKKRIKELEEAQKENNDVKETLQNVLVTAQRSSEEMRESSRKEAELIVKEAISEAEEIKRKAENDVVELERKKEELKNDIDMFITKMSALFEAQAKYLNGKTECGKEEL